MACNFPLNFLLTEKVSFYLMDPDTRWPLFCFKLPFLDYFGIHSESCIYSHHAHLLELVEATQCIKAGKVNRDWEWSAKQIEINMRKRWMDLQEYSLYWSVCLRLLKATTTDLINSCTGLLSSACIPLVISLHLVLSSASFDSSS